MKRYIHVLFALLLIFAVSCDDDKTNLSFQRGAPCSVDAPATCHEGNRWFCNPETQTVDSETCTGDCISASNAPDSTTQCSTCPANLIISGISCDEDTYPGCCLNETAATCVNGAVMLIDCYGCEVAAANTTTCKTRPIACEGDAIIAGKSCTAESYPGCCLPDGSALTCINYKITRQDSCINCQATGNNQVNCDLPDHCGGTNRDHGTVNLRIMAANTTSGSQQSYQGPGIRMFQGIKPDVALVQEFRYEEGSIRDLVDLAFGEEYNYHRGEGRIANGIVTRYPIIEYGEWESNEMHDRGWTWAVIDLPGPRDLLAVSLHLSTKKNSSEMGPLLKKINEKRKTCNDYVVIGGDFNTKNRDVVKSKLSSLFDTSGPYPADQNGRDGTNRSRKKPYDWVLASYDLETFEKPLVIGSNTFSNGLVLDSTVYTPLSDIAPVEEHDSNASNMQHMPVIREFVFTY